jgi:K+-sensing histidine kinase KdpD
MSNGMKHHATNFIPSSGRVDRPSRGVQNLLEMARIESGECRPVMDWGSVPNCWPMPSNWCERLWHHQVRLDIPDNLPLVRWDERLMGQVLSESPRECRKVFAGRHGDRPRSCAARS